MGKQLSSKAILAIAVGISASLAIGLGVGLGVGLQKEVFVYAIEPTKTEPTKTTSTAGIIVEDTTAVNPGSDADLQCLFITVVTENDAPWLNYRLPDYIIPSHYKLSLTMDIDAGTYVGRNEIRFNVTQNTRYVLIHAHESLNINSVALQWENDGGKEPWDIANEFRYPEYEYYVITAKNILPAGEEFILTIDFTNSLTDAFVGIFKSTYTDPGDGSEKYMVVSDMQPTNARRGYPCFDEPAMKVRFETTITHDPAYYALSNMAVERETSFTDGSGRSWTSTEFKESVPMSTYIACFIVCQFGYVEGFSKRNIPLRIYATPFQINNGDADYALEVTTKLLDEYEQLFDMEYPLPKYDQIAIPNLANFGAMENWGIVTFREDSLLWSKNDSSTANRQRVAAVVAHEMVHSWFGNIVTLSWWENLWLNEGFASYFEYKGLSWAEPDWLYEGHHVIDDVQTAMRADALSGSHPLKVNVSSPAQISEVFDSISYQKGSSVLKMINDVLGNDLFIGGLRYYLQDHQFGIANENDLYESMQRYIDENEGGYTMTEIMDPWVQQRGFPLITVGTAGSSYAKQSIMLADPSVADSNPSYVDNIWGLKLDYYTQSNTSDVKEAWFTAVDTIDDMFDLTDAGDWYKFNFKERGYWRVKYEDSVWDALVTQLRDDPSVFHPYDRSQLLDDAFNLAPIDEIPYTTALNLTTYLDTEESYFVWSAYSSGNSYISSMLASTEHRDNFMKYYLTRVKPIADKLGWDVTTGTHEDKLNRPLVLGLALGYGDQEALGNASNLFSEWRNGGSINPDIRSLVYRYGILNGNVSDWEFMLERYKNEDVAGEKTNLLRGLAATEDVELIDRLLDYSKDTSIIKDQDFFTCISYISYSVNGNRMAWSWVRINWDYMVERFTLESRGLGRLVPTIVSDYNTEIKKWEVENFFAANPEAGSGEDARVNALLQINLNIAWLDKNEATIGEWLQDRVDELP